MNTLSIALTITTTLTIYWLVTAAQLHILSTRLKTSHKKAENECSRTERPLRVSVEIYESQAVTNLVTGGIFGGITMLLLLAQIILPHL